MLLFLGIIDQNQCHFQLLFDFRAWQKNKDNPTRHREHFSNFLLVFTERASNKIMKTNIEYFNEMICFDPKFSQKSFKWKQKTQHQKECIYYKSRQLCFITNWGKYCWKMGSSVIINWGKYYYKFGQLFHIGAILTTKWVSYYKSGQNLLQILGRCCKLRELLQIEA